MSSKHASTTSDLKVYSDLLDKLYLGADEKDPWQAFLDALRDILDLQYATLLLRTPSPSDSGLLFNAGGDAQATLLDGSENIYTENYFALDPLVNLPFGEVVTLGDVIPPGKLLGSDYYQLFLQPFEIAHSAGIDLQDDQGKRFCLRMTRSPGQPDFTELEKTYVELLAPHLKRAVSLGVKLHQLDSEHQVYVQSMSRRLIGIAHLDKDGQILHLNRAAKDLLEEKDGIHQQHRHLQIKNGDLNDRFKGYVDEALQAQRDNTRLPMNAIAVPRISAQPDYEVVIKPLPVDRHFEAEGTPRLMIFIQAPEKNMVVSVRLFMHLYGLTVSEATLAIILAEGKTMDEVSADLGVTKNTARAHLRAIFAKTGVTQQSMLVSLVLKSLASVP